jgi:hypothetical protein
MSSDDDKNQEIEQSRTQDQGLASPAKREAAEKRKILKIFSQKALKAKDARAYAEQLRLLKISENSVEWKNAWKFFYSE